MRLKWNVFFFWSMLNLYMFEITNEPEDSSSTLSRIKSDKHQDSIDWAVMSKATHV